MKTKIIFNFLTSREKNEESFKKNREITTVRDLFYTKSNIDLTRKINKIRENIVFSEFFTKFDFDFTNNQEN